ncbi:MAG: outer membrane lipoprotein-sorting protein [Candidatus Omnitrophica bacterium]|nr:outer membrane lipoprotein-sorting protein [Candidatus Omnitrophota bacterium]
MRGLKFLSFLFLFFGLTYNNATAESNSASYQILRKADQARGNLEGVTWKVGIVSQEGESKKHRVFNVKARGFDIRAQNLSPAKYKGNKLLMVKGNMWFYKPDLSKPVPVSRRQRLLGNATYGDIASTNYAEDYTAAFLKEEVINGEICYVYELEAKPDRMTTYDRIKYWVSKERSVGVKADYFTVSGKKFKSAVMEYENSVELDSKKQPFISQIIIYEALMSKNVTILTFAEPVMSYIDDHIFNLNLLRK